MQPEEKKLQPKNAPILMVLEDLLPSKNKKASLFSIKKKGKLLIGKNSTTLSFSQL